MNIFQILVLRSNVEKLLNDLNLPADKKAGTIDNIEWFLKNGYRQNKSKSTFNETKKLCKIMLKEITHDQKNKINN
jgi:hypothetical protein